MGLPRSVFVLSVPQLERLIRERAAVTAQVRFTLHAEQRMRSRRVSRAEVFDRMQRFLAGREIGVVAAMSDDDPSAVVVTVLVLQGGL